MENLIQTLIDPVNGNRVQAIHSEDARMLIAENTKMKTAIIEFCNQHNWAADIWKRQPHISALFEIAKA